jgi:hypothetical protein
LKRLAAPLCVFNFGMNESSNKQSAFGNQRSAKQKGVTQALLPLG